MVYKLTYENMLYLALGLVSIFIIYKLVKKYDSSSNNSNGSNGSNSSNGSNGTEEGFQSIINKFKNARNTGNSRNTGNASNSSNAGKSKKKVRNGGGVSFDDLITEAEDMDLERYTVDKIKNNFFTYVESFQKAKFKNITGTTDEALEKFGFFKDKFFEIFK